MLQQLSKYRYIVWGIILQSGTLFGAIVQKNATMSFDYGTSVFSTASRSYLGTSACSPTKQEWAITVALICPGSNPVHDIALAGIAFEKVLLVNGDPTAKDRPCNPTVPSPVFDQAISQVALFGSAPTVLLGTDTVAPILGANKKVALLGGGSPGQEIKTNIEEILSANGTDGGPIERIEGGLFQTPCLGRNTTSGVLFAAVPPAGLSFGSAESGIALLAVPEKGPLITVDAQTGNKLNNRAQRLSLVPGELTAIDATSQILGLGDMHWDSELQRLYVSLRLKRDNDAASGGVVALLIGRIQITKFGPQLILEPVVPLAAASFTADSDDHIFGFYYNNATAVQSQVHHVRLMRTSSGFTYGILNAATDVNVVHNQVYAVPLVQPSDCNNQGSSLGHVANINDFSQPALNAAQMPLASDPATVVGAGPLPISENQPLQRLVVVGDTVYALLAGDPQTGERTADYEAGIFASTALLNTDGKVMRWSPWRRAMGSVDAVINGTFVESLGSFFYLTPSSSNPEALSQFDPYDPYDMYDPYDDPCNLLPSRDTLKATRWGSGAGDRLLGGVDKQDNGLVQVLEQSFSSCKGGVHFIADFDATTPTFSAPDMIDSLALMVATGYEQVALIETGNHDGMTFNPNTGDFKIFTQYSTDGSFPTPGAQARVAIISGGDLCQLGPIHAAAISRNSRADMTDNGWLFVGGRGGFAVLSTEAGDGWNTAMAGGLKRGFVGLDDTFSFKRVSGICTVRSLVSDDQFLYVLTDKKLLRIALDATNFSTAGVQAPTVVELADATSITGAACGSLRDVLISSKLALLATNTGLYRVGNGANITTAASEQQLGWTKVFANAVSPEPVLSLTGISATVGDFAAGGNVYALTADLRSSISLVRRFAIADTTMNDIDDLTVQQIPASCCEAAFLTFGALWQFFQTDGAQIFIGQPPFGNCPEQLKYFTMDPDLRGICDRGCCIQLENHCKPALYSLGRPTLNSASGAWIVPNHAGIRVHE